MVIKGVKLGTETHWDVGNTEGCQKFEQRKVPNSAFKIAGENYIALIHPIPE